MAFIWNRVHVVRIACAFIISLLGASGLAWTQEAGSPASVAPAGEVDPIATALAIGSYKECLTNNGRVTFACGAQSCPGGTKYLRTINRSIPECNSSSCVNMKALGWKKGNKTKFCRNRGYDGVRAASRHDYGKGGCCFKNS
ncbi:hypothetical protein [Variovorax paradoxus]|uniref:hypothetical protein n=1 Tax=Variovorax paradoxus TaxID=34073 RepID=UPI0029C88F59|nr:hypothetical protein RZE77_03055 [Variovorax paradoxus]